MNNTHATSELHQTPSGHQQHSCNCGICQEMCQRSPCFPTPHDTLKIIEAGYADKLSFAMHANVEEHLISRVPVQEYILIAPETKENGHCVFYNDGLCDLHDQGLKPTEGKFASHNKSDNGLRSSVCNKWISKAGLTMLEYFLKFVQEKDNHPNRKTIEL